MNKWNIILLSLITVILAGILFQQIRANNKTSGANQILLVQFADEDSDKDVSEQKVIKESLERGGSITINVASVREIDPLFDSMYAVTNSEGNFMTIPALLNWVSARRWRFQETFIGGNWVFVR